MINYNTLTEDFDYNDLDIKNPEQDAIEKIVNCAVASDNIKIPLNVLFPKIFKIRSPENLTIPLKFLPYQGWENPDNKKSMLERRLLKKTNKTYYDQVGSPFNADRIGFFSFNFGYDLHSHGFILICNLTPIFQQIDQLSLNSEVIECINSYIKYVTGHDYDIRNTMFGKKYTEQTGCSLYYQIWVSPDNGLILVDHITEYPAGAVDFNKFTCMATIKDEPISMSMGALIFTNLKAYKIQEKNFDNIINRQKYIDAKNEFINCFETSQNLNINRGSHYNIKAIRHPDIMLDKNNHIWYSAANRLSYSSDTWFHVLPELRESAIIPDDLTKLPTNVAKLYKFTTLSNAMSNKMICCMMHPKIKGFKYEGNSGFIIYETNDPEFCEKLLGSGAAEYIKGNCDMYAKFVDLGIIKLYTFIWYDNNLMKAYDEFMDNPGLNPDDILKKYI